MREVERGNAARRQGCCREVCPCSAGAAEASKVYSPEHDESEDYSPEHDAWHLPRAIVTRSKLQRVMRVQLLSELSSGSCYSRRLRHGEGGGIKVSSRCFHRRQPAACIQPVRVAVGRVHHVITDAAAAAKGHNMSHVEGVVGGGASEQEQARAPEVAAGGKVGE